MSATAVVTTETITPEVAAEYLLKNKKNRNKKPTKIVVYARDMKAGRWAFTGEAIKFDSNGNLIDGQNRLYACIEADAAFTTLVIRGIAPESQGIMDSGAPRSGADQLSLRGFASGKDLQAVANAHFAYKSGRIKTPFSSLGSPDRLTNSEIVPYVEANPGVTEAADWAQRIRQDLPLTVGAIGVAVDTFRQIDADDAHDFFDRVRNMDTRGKGDPIATLIKRVTHERASGRRIELAFGVYLLFRAWNAYRAGEDLQKFQLGSSANGWTSIPEPK